MLDKLKNYFKTLLLIFAILIINSCNKDSYNFDFVGIKVEGSLTPSYAVPLVDANFTLEEFIPDSDSLDRFLTIDDDGFITIGYTDQVAEYLIEDFMGDEPLSGSSLPFLEYSIDPQIINLNLNNLLNGGSIYFANPTLKIIITNYWDIPAKFRLKDFYYYEEENSPAIPVTGPAISIWDTIPGPPNMGDSIIHEIVLDTASSNIDELLSAMPHHLSLGAEFETIPGAPYNLPAGSTNKVGIEVSIPMDLRLSNIQFTDTLDFDLGINTDSAKLTNLAINFAAENGFPIGMKTQVYFVDSNYVVLDSLFTDGRFDLQAAKVSNGQTSESVKSKVTMEFSDDRMDKILGAKYLIPNILFNSTDAQNNKNVKLYSTYQFGIKLGSKADMEITM